MRRREHLSRFERFSPPQGQSLSSPSTCFDERSTHDRYPFDVVPGSH
jgi:hypothetical protein